MVSLFKICFLLPFLLFFSGGEQPKQKDSFWKGNGTKNDPFLISNVEDLEFLKEQVNHNGQTYQGVFFSQTCDLDFSNMKWDAIGSLYDGTAFRGTYNGNGHTISSLESPTDSEYCYGFFGHLGGTVMNLGITSGIIRGNASGGIASHSTGDGGGLILNCFSSADIIANRSGGLADNFIGGRIINCISAGSTMGPIVGSVCTIAVGLAQNVAYRGVPTGQSFEGELWHMCCIDEMGIAGAVKEINQYVEDSTNNKMAGFNIKELARFSVTDEGKVSFDGFFAADDLGQLRRNQVFKLIFLGALFVVIALPLLCLLFRKKA